MHLPKNKIIKDNDTAQDDDNIKEDSNTKKNQRIHHHNLLKILKLKEQPDKSSNSIKEPDKQQEEVAKEEKLLLK